MTALQVREFPDDLYAELARRNDEAEAVAS